MQSGLVFLIVSGVRIHVVGQTESGDLKQKLGSHRYTRLTTLRTKKKSWSGEKNKQETKGQKTEGNVTNYALKAIVCLNKTELTL